MNGLYYSFDRYDIEIGSNGSFVTANTDNQNVALISMSQVCRLTRPELGAEIPARIINVRRSSADAVFSDAMQQARSDGATDAFVGFDQNDNLIFRGNYDS